ncbi:Hint domain-containing protein [Cobetia marina]
MALLDVSVGDSDTDDSNDVIDVDLLDSDGLISVDINCFAKGTEIMTPKGARPIETLQVGDDIMTADNRMISIKWIGRQTTRPKDFNENLQAIKIRKHAIAHGVPTSDLVLTAGHGIVVDDLLINASVLVNGSSIDYVPLEELDDEVTYYHIESWGHETILANGTPAETYIDYKDRASFDNYDEYLALYKSEARIQEMCRPRISARRLLPMQVCQRLGIDIRMDYSLMA